MSFSILALRSVEDGSGNALLPFLPVPNQAPGSSA
jgi:hypothetical protein